MERIPQTMTQVSTKKLIEKAKSIVSTDREKTHGNKKIKWTFGIRTRPWMTRI